MFGKLVLMSLMIATAILPAIAARKSMRKEGYQKLMTHLRIACALYILVLAYLFHHVMHW